MKDQRINYIKNPPKTDADIAKQVDKIKQNIGGVSFDIYDESNFSFMDLVVPLKIIYDPDIKNKNIAVSLDPLVPT